MYTSNFLTLLYISILGTTFGSGADDVTITVGDETCVVTSHSSTEVTCTVAVPQGGSQSMRLTVTGYGEADFTTLSVINVSSRKYGTFSVLKNTASL